MDKAWMHCDRRTKEYQDGVKKFIKFAKENSEKHDQDGISCPCKSCKNLRIESCETVKDHLITEGLDSTYVQYVWHGEQPNRVRHDDDMPILDGDVDITNHGVDVDLTNDDEDVGMPNDGDGVDETLLDEFLVNEDPSLYPLLGNEQPPLYPGCTKYTRLSATTVLYRQKNLFGWSNKSFNKLLEILHDMFPMSTLLESMGLIRKLLKEFELDYKKIDGCVNDCYLFQGALANADECSKCKVPRWKVDPCTNKIHKKVPKKRMRYFPIIPRFRRMFDSPEKAKDLMWHANHRSEDGNMRHPVDSLAWDTIDRMWPSFSNDPRNLRLGLAADGVNPFRSLSSTYSCWPVMLVVYNLPPWMCMKKEFMMLTMLIPGPKQPGNNIDVYLEPLVDDLLELWNIGVISAIKES